MGIAHRHTLIEPLQEHALQVLVHRVLARAQLLGRRSQRQPERPQLVRLEAYQSIHSYVLIELGGAKQHPQTLVTFNRCVRFACFHRLIFEL